MSADGWAAWLTRERLAWMALAIACGATGMAWRAGSLTPASARASSANPAAHDHNRAHMRPTQADIERVVAVNAGSLSAAKPCRQGAFVEASGIINSAVEMHRALPKTTPERTRAELDTVLYTALKQARSEVHCVAGVITHGYDKSYAESIRRGMGMARERGLSADVAVIGQDVIDALYAAPNRAVASSGKN